MDVLLLTNKIADIIDTFCVSMIKYLKDNCRKGNLYFMMCVRGVEKLKMCFAAGFFAAGLFPIFKI